MRRWFDGRKRQGPAVFAVTILLVAACGGGPGSNGSTPDPTREPLPTKQGASEAPVGGIEDQIFAVGQHFWHSGFRVDVVEGEIASTEDNLSKRVTTVLRLSVTLENLGSGTGFFGPAVAIVTSDNSYAADPIANGISDTPGGLKGKGFFLFLIDKDFDLPSAELLIGDPDENQARIPLSGNGTPVRLEPSEPPISGTLSMELVDLVFTSANLRYDNPDRHRQIEKGKLALTLTFDVVSRKSGSWNIHAQDLALILPDGIAVAADGIDIGSLEGSDEGLTTPDGSARFLVDEMPAGDYTLRFSPGSWAIGVDGVTEATFDFTIP